MDEEAKQELQYEMGRLTELLGEMKDAIETFGQKGFFRKMFAATKVVRRLASMERRKEAIMSAMDRVLQRVQTELNLDQRDRVQLETKEHTYALEAAVWAKVEERTKANGGDVDVEADVSEAADKIMRDPDALKEVADSAGLSEEAFREAIALFHEELEEIKGTVQEEGEKIRKVAIEEHAHTRDNAWQVAADVAVDSAEARLIGARAERDYLLEKAAGPHARGGGQMSSRSVVSTTNSNSSDGATDTVGVMCCHIPYFDSQFSEVAGASRVEGEKKVLVAIEGARILSPASIESMEDAIAQSNPRGVHIAGHNQVQFVHLLLELALTYIVYMSLYSLRTVLRRPDADRRLLQPR
jgi:hypothetical protein